MNHSALALASALLVGSLQAQDRSLLAAELTADISPNGNAALRSLQQELRANLRDELRQELQGNLLRLQPELLSQHSANPQGPGFAGAAGAAGCDARAHCAP